MIIHHKPQYILRNIEKRAFKNQNKLWNAEYINTELCPSVTSNLIILQKCVLPLSNRTDIMYEWVILFMSNFDMLCEWHRHLALKIDAQCDLCSCWSSIVKKMPWMHYAHKHKHFYVFNFVRKKCIFLNLVIGTHYSTINFQLESGNIDLCRSYAHILHLILKDGSFVFLLLLFYLWPCNGFKLCAQNGP